MIENIVIKNFKSIHTGNEGLPLRPLNVLIGRNGSGKSNFLKFFELLREGAEGRLRDTILAWGGFRQVKSYEEKNIFETRITFSAETIGKNPLTYEVSLQGNSNLYVVAEVISVARSEMNVFEPVIRVNSGTVEQTNSAFPTRLRKVDELVVSQIRDFSHQPLISHLGNQLTNWQIFRGFDETAFQNIRSPQIFNIVDPFQLDLRGKNLVSILQQLANQPEYADINQTLLESFKAVFQDVVQFKTPISGGGYGSLSYESSHFKDLIPAISMSDGQLRFLGLALLLLLPTPPALISIDEPEIGLHPRALPILVELMQEASKRTQLIVTTHSPQLISLLNPEDVITVENEDGQSHLRRLDTADLGRWMERYNLGELWTMGRLKA